MLTFRPSGLAFAWSLLHLAPSLTEAITAEPIPPLQDPWYTTPAGFENELPGAVLRAREAPGNLTELLANCSAAYNILYRTTNSQYQPDWAVTTVFMPVNQAEALLSYQIPYDSVYLDASPSYALYASSSGPGSTLADISTGLSNGWFVNVPDYEGPLASFTAGVISGHATLDSIRAVFNANRLLGWGLPQDARYAMWGYSGGALASEWAAELQIQYAPEMKFSGAALGGLTPNLTSVLYSINEQVFVGLTPASILGLASQYPDVMEYVLSRLKPEGEFNSTGILATYNYTLTDSILAFLLHDIGDYFIGGLDDATSPEAMKAIINRDGIMGYHGTPMMPTFAYKAIDDEVSVVEDTDALIDRFCNNGANILYNRNSVGGHTDEQDNGRPAALEFLARVLNGTRGEDFPATGCIIQNITSNITNAGSRKRDGKWRLYS